MGVIHDRAFSKAREIEEELRRIGWWDIPQPPPEAFESEAAFCMDTMAFPQWIRHGLLPIVYRLAAEEGEFPASSSVAAQAVREFDGEDRAEHLVSLLSEFDALFSGARTNGGGGLR